MASAGSDNQLSGALIIPKLCSTSIQHPEFAAVEPFPDDRGRDMWDDPWQDEQRSQEPAQADSADL